MPTTAIKNLCYRAALPFLAPRPGHMVHRTEGQPLRSMAAYERLLCRHHVMGASLLLCGAGRRTAVYTSTLSEPVHSAEPDMLFRVASITKMATALVTLRMAEAGAFALDDPVAALLPEACDGLQGITLRQLLCHTSGLRDTPACDEALKSGKPYGWVLAQPGVRKAAPGAAFSYCNFGFGLVGCVLEQASGWPVSRVFDEWLIRPLGMNATLDASGLDASRLMPITRVLRYHPGQEVTVPPLGRVPLSSADPLCHFGHTAGSLYTDAASLSRLLALLQGGGELNGQRLLSAASAADMCAEHASYGRADRRLSYGLGLLIIRDSGISRQRILGHQGFSRREAAVRSSSSTAAVPRRGGAGWG